MPKGVERVWPADDELLTLVQQEGSINRAAGRLGIADKTLRSHFIRRGLLDQAKEITQTTLDVTAGEVTREEILEAENRELRLALAKDRKTSVTAARIEAAVKDALLTVKPPPVRPSKPKTTVSKDAHHRVLLQLSDFHGGEDVNPDVVSGKNDYSWDIMQARLDELHDSVLSYKRNFPKLTGIDVTFGGDMCSGSNHLELAVTNEFPLAEQGVRMGYTQAQIVERLVPHFGDVRVFAVEGNHPRLSQKPSAKDPHNNMDWVASVLAKECLAKHPGVQYVIGRATMTFEIAGRTVWLMHGDGIRSSMPGVPWGGVMRRVNTLQSNSTRRIDHFLIHHFHQANVVQGGRILMNGALKGTDEWVEKTFGGGDPPTQMLHLFDEKHRRYVSTSLITPKAGLP